VKLTESAEAITRLLLAARDGSPEAIPVGFSGAEIGAPRQVGARNDKSENSRRSARL
jgi:hypothetical protein